MTRRPIVRNIMFQIAEICSKSTFPSKEVYGLISDLKLVLDFKNELVSKGSIQHIA